MGFRFNKRIKLGKGLGVYLSKSGITPSYRNKKGSLSSKGFSLRTGIPGLTYRKAFPKAKNKGCILFFIIPWILLLFMLSCSNLENVDNSNSCQSDLYARWIIGTAFKCN